MPDTSLSVAQILARWLRRAAHILDHPESPRPAQPVALEAASEPAVNVAAADGVAPAPAPPTVPEPADQETVLQAEVRQLIKDALAGC